MITARMVAALLLSSQWLLHPMPVAYLSMEIGPDISPISAMQYRARTRRKNAVRAASRKARRAQMQQAEELFRRCLDMAPCDGRAYVGLGRILVDVQRYGEAFKLYEEGVRLTGMPRPPLTQSHCAPRRRQQHDARPVD